MTIDYREDLETIMDQFKVLATQKREVESYNDRGEATTTFTTVVTAYVSIQAADIKNESYIGEEGKVEVFSHNIFACYNVNGSVLTVVKGDRFYVGSDFYEVKQVVEHDQAHLELYTVQVRGKA